MNKTLILIVIIIILVIAGVLAIIFTQKSSQSDENDAKKLVGIWKQTELFYKESSEQDWIKAPNDYHARYIKFSQDNVACFNYDILSQKCNSNQEVSYSIEDNKIIFYSPGEHATIYLFFNFVDGKLELITDVPEEHSKVIYKREEIVV